MARSKTVTSKVPQPIEDALDLHMQAGRFGSYANKNQLAVGLKVYAAIFPRVHTLTAEIARLPAAEQDAIHDLVLAAARDGRDLAAELPKPATAQDLLKLAKL